jgi:perosamine synthetase
MIPIAQPLLGDEELNNVIEAVKSGWISSKGRFISEFEKNAAKYFGGRYGIATSSGTTALHLALVALGIGKGDEVIVPNLSFIATANVVRYTGAKPVFVDVHPEYWCIDPEKIKKKITKKTKAIIPVHLYGHPCDMDMIKSIACNNNGLYIIEDAAEAHGAEYKGEKVGSFGDIACFSFFGNKIITTGEGGICITNDENIAKEIQILRDHGMNPKKKYWHDRIGFNYRMTNIQAAVGVAQLKKIDQFIKKKREIVKKYNSLLKDVEGITLPPEMPWAKSVYWIYSILVDENFGLSRDKLRERLGEKGIDTRPLFYPLSELPPYKSKEAFPVAKSLSTKGISLPSPVSLNEEEIERIVQEIIRLKVNRSNAL